MGSTGFIVSIWPVGSIGLIGSLGSMGHFGSIGSLGSMGSIASKGLYAYGFRVLGFTGLAGFQGLPYRVYGYGVSEL